MELKLYVDIYECVVLSLVSRRLQVWLLIWIVGCLVYGELLGHVRCCMHDGIFLVQQYLPCYSRVGVKESFA